MEMIELHILQSCPVSCLNRDDVGAPKTAVFGGVSRARVSSQCWKRAIRIHAQQSLHGAGRFSGQRSRRWVRQLSAALRERQVADADATAALAIGYLASKEEPERGALVYLTPLQLEALASSIVEQRLVFSKDKNGVKCKAARGNSIAGILGAASDWADIAIFGRMVANDHTLTLEGAGLFSHALSTHRVSNEIDFFTAVDDVPQNEQDGYSAGAAHMGTLEYNSACYYRYVGLNLTLLSDADHLGALVQEERRTVVDTFLRAAVEAIPGARHNSMFASTLPQYILGLYRAGGQPLSLANAFEEPVWSNSGLLSKSWEVLLGHFGTLKQTYDISATEYRIPDVTLAGMVEGLCDHVR